MRSISTHLVGRPAGRGNLGARRVFPSEMLDHADPFVLLERFDAELPGGTEAEPSHLHRGIEVVTLLTHGSLEVRDSSGHEVLQAGGVQWSTAGGGFTRSTHATRGGGRVAGLRLGIKLPEAQCTCAPESRYLGASEIPTTSGEGWSARVLSGELSGVTGTLGGRVPMLLADVSIDRGTLAEIPAPRTSSAFAFVVEGRLPASKPYPPVRVGELVRFHANGDVVGLQTGRKGARVLIAVAERLREPIVRGGPFAVGSFAD